MTLVIGDGLTNDDRPSSPIGGSLLCTHEHDCAVGRARQQVTAPYDNTSSLPIRHLFPLIRYLFHVIRTVMALVVAAAVPDLQWTVDLEVGRAVVWLSNASRCLGVTRRGQGAEESTQTLDAATRCPDCAVCANW